MKGTVDIENTFVIHATAEKAPVLVDMSEVEFIASIGMRLLVRNAKSLATRGGNNVTTNGRETRIS